MSDVTAQLTSDRGRITLPDMHSYSDVMISLTDSAKRYSLRIKEATIDEFCRGCGVSLPTAIGCTTSDETKRFYCLGPDEWLVIATADEDMAQLFAKPDMPHSLVDISHRQIGFLIEGADAVEAINVGCPLDLSLQAFPIGKVTRTIFERAQIMIYRAGATRFEVEIWRSFAPYFLRLMEKGR